MKNEYVVKLAEYGLNEAEIKVYLFLLQHGEFRISDIANMNSLPRSSVYEALKTLSRMGLVEETIYGNFKKIRALPFHSINHYFGDKISELQHLRSTTDEIEKSLDALPDLRGELPTQVKYYDSVSGARQLFWNTLKAKDIVYVYSSWGRSKYVGKAFYKEFVAASKKRNIAEKVLVENQPSLLKQIRANLSTASLSRTSLKNVRTINRNNMVIAGEIFMYGNTYAQITLKSDHISGFEIQNQKFVDMQRAIFKTLWSSAKPVK